MEKLEISITELVKNQTAEFEFYRSGKLYYNINHSNGNIYQFTVDVEDKDDIGFASFEKTHKALNLMRYVNKSIKDETFLKLK